MNNDYLDTYNFDESEGMTEEEKILLDKAKRDEEYFYKCFHSFFNTEDGKFCRKKIEEYLMRPSWTPGMPQDNYLIIEGCKHYARSLLEGADEVGKK